MIDAWARNLISTQESESKFDTVLDARLRTRATVALIQSLNIFI